MFGLTMDFTALFKPLVDALKNPVSIFLFSLGLFVVCLIIQFMPPILGVDFKQLKQHHLFSLFFPVIIWAALVICFISFIILTINFARKLWSEKKRDDWQKGKPNLQVVFSDREPCYYTPVTGDTELTFSLVCSNKECVYIHVRNLHVLKPKNLFQISCSHITHIQYERHPTANTPIPIGKSGVVRVKLLIRGDVGRNREPIKLVVRLTDSKNYKYDIRVEVPVKEIPD